MNLPYLPHDILGVVVDEAESDRKTLRTLSLVSRAFVSPSQRRLFKNLTIHPPSRTSKSSSVPKLCTNLRDVLRDNKHLHRYVQEVHLVEKERGWLLCNIAEEILSLLSSSPIRRLSILFFTRPDTVNRRWGDLSSGFLRAVCKVLENPQFEHLTLFNVSLIPRHLPERFPNIRHLTLKTVTFASTSDDSVTTDRNQVQTTSRLQHLSLGRAGPGFLFSGVRFTYPFSDNNLSQIHSITLSLSKPPTVDIRPLLQLDHLKVLHIYFEFPSLLSRFYTRGHGLNFAALPSLEELTFSGNPSEGEDKRYILPWDSEVKECLSTYLPTSLRRLNVIFKLGTMKPGRFLDELRDTLLDLSKCLTSAYQRSEEMLEITIGLETENQMMPCLQRKATSLLSWPEHEDIWKVEFTYGPTLPYELY
ncbi:hypothetical protein BDN72DRAFT_965187 [Pluteus cervinus]|uniref:Uncharacterized protein n=1 Tax=Pluteus cervinus TaxID=181527 RepID=A0ACD3A6X4_9AGAR|nr:hypothetical protein BDN72DRAFT_965187 [Pluteus cervinus]